jgi:aryl-alcohol dehydrogenase-like predicted oxidoreductase
MERRTLGKTGLAVSRLGAGLSEIGYRLTLNKEAQAGQVLNEALDRGINFLDTSACYDISEELIGRTIAHRRHEYILATKCGHVTGGYQGEEWSAQTISDSIDRSLVRMQTDYLDLVQLHTCDVDILEKGEAIAALEAAKRAGKTRFIGYSGDNEAAAWAIESGIFDTLQTSYNLVDQRARTHLFPQAKAQNMGLIVKRPIANGAWGVSQSPSSYADGYFQRAQHMAELGAVSAAPDDRILLSLGFVWANEAIDTAIVGTHNPAHMRANIHLVETQLPIDKSVVEELQRRFAQVGDSWQQLT